MVEGGSYACLNIVLSAFYLSSSIDGYNLNFCALISWFSSSRFSYNHLDFFMCVLTTLQGLECVVTEISTLMYATVSSREFRSCTVLLPGGDLVVNDSFPNTRYGFNTRTLTIGTKPVSLVRL